MRKWVYVWAYSLSKMTQICCFDRFMDDSWWFNTVWSVCTNPMTHSANSSEVVQNLIRRGPKMGTLRSKVHNMTIGRQIHICVQGNLEPLKMGNLMQRGNRPKRPKLDRTEQEWDGIGPYWPKSRLSTLKAIFGHIPTGPQMGPFPRTTPNSSELLEGSRRWEELKECNKMWWVDEHSDIVLSDAQHTTHVTPTLVPST